jgi:predicted acyltransferase
LNQQQHIRSAHPSTERANARPAPGTRIAFHGGRVESLDVLRGFAVAGMIVVNNPGDWNAVFSPLLHAYWTGITFADLVFPSFVFVMGVSLPLAFARRLSVGATSNDLHHHIGRRAAVLIALGLALNAVSAWPDAWPLRFPGVLQRIALSYLIASVLVLHVRPSRWLVIAAVCLMGHWALLALVPFDGHPAGTLMPEHNLARYIDTFVFGRHASTPIEPEGLLGTLTASATAILGATVGQLIRQQPAAAARVSATVAAGTAFLVVGLLWSRALPLSKPLWTGSFVLVTAGLTTLALAVLDFVVDVCGLRRWGRPFVWLSANALALYVGSEIVRRLLDTAVITQQSASTTPKAWLFWEVLEPAFRARPELGSLVFAVGMVVVWVVLGGILYRRRTRRA